MSPNYIHQKKKKKKVIYANNTLNELITLFIFIESLSYFLY